MGKCGIADLLNRLKDKRPGEEFFLIWNGRWCAGYMALSGITQEMNVSIEVCRKTALEALRVLRKRTK